MRTNIEDGLDYRRSLARACAACAVLLTLLCLPSAADAQTHPIYRLYASANGDRMLSFDVNEASSWYDAEEGYLFYSSAAAAPGPAHPVYRCYIYGWDHMPSTASNCEIGYGNEGARGYLLDSPASGHAALYRCRNWSTQDHFSSKSSYCEGQIYEGILGYYKLGYVPLGDGFSEAQVGWGNNCWYSGNDTDADTLNQSCEAAIAANFAPTQWFDNGEDTDGWWPHYAVRSLNYASKTVRVAYYDSFYRDGGGIAGLTSHDGDSEFVIIDLHFDGTSWMVDWMYLSAHRNAPCDGSNWYHYTQIEWDQIYRGWASVFVSENKHALYRTDSECDAACFWQENCDYDYYKVPATNRNVGQSWSQLMSVVQLGYAYEWFWDTNKKFCGWQRNGYYASHSGCAGSYYNHMQDFSL